MPTPEDFDGCNSECRRAGTHTLRWGGCEHAPEPEPTVSMSVVYDDVDGGKSIGFDSYTVPQLGELITAGLRASDLPVNGDDLVDVGLVAAHAIVHRNDANNAEHSARTTADNSPTSSDTPDKPAVTEWTPPPPGDRREQLPAHLLALVNIPPYTSTACEMAGSLTAAADEYQDRADGIAAWVDRLHARCRLNNKFTGASCVCGCHHQTE